MIDFCCPQCGASIQFQDKRSICQRCAHQGKIDEFGIIRLANKDFYYREMPREDLEYIIEADTKDEIWRRFDERLLKKSYKYASYIKSYALDANRGAGVCLLNIDEQSTVLDFGSGWGNMTRVLANICKEVVTVDLTYESLLFGARISNHKNITYVHTGDQRYLPFEEQTFDAIILNGVLEWIPEGAYLDQNPRAVQQSFLRQLYRLLRPGGQLYVAIENRYGIWYFFGAKEDHTALKYGALLPRALSNLYSMRVRKKPYRTYTYSYQGYKKLLGEVGFETAIYHPWPNYRRFRHIYSSETINSYQPEESYNKSKKGRLKKLALNSLTKLGLFQHLTPAFAIVATKPPLENKTTLLGKISSTNTEPPSHIDSIQLSSTKTILMKSGRYFYKIPLTTESSQRLARTVEAQELLKRNFPDLLPYAISNTDLHAVGNVTYSKDPLYQPIDPNSPAIQELFHLYFQAVAKYVKAGRVNLSERLSLLIEFAQQTLEEPAHLEEMVSHLNQKVWPLAPTHGDLHAGNVIKVGEEIALIDWDRFEVSGPYQIDALHAFMREQMRHSKITWAIAIADLAQEIIKTTPQEKSMYGVTIDRDAINLYILDRLEKDISSVPHYSYLGEPWRSQADSILRQIHAIK